MKTLQGFSPNGLQRELFSMVLNNSRRRKRVL